MLPFLFFVLLYINKLQLFLSVMYHSLCVFRNIVV
jgi:hypothetical protein